MFIVLPSSTIDYRLVLSFLLLGYGFLLEGFEHPISCCRWNEGGSLKARNDGLETTLLHIFFLKTKTQTK